MGTMNATSERRARPPSSNGLSSSTKRGLARRATGGEQGGRTQKREGGTGMAEAHSQG
jgi:hypothetical protein